MQQRFCPIHLTKGMNMKLTTFSIMVVLSGCIPSVASVPLRWSVETSRAQPAQFDAYHGETIDLEASFQSYGKPLEITAPASLYYQTNGMGAAWWTAPAAVASNTISATFAPALDPGAPVLNCFLGGTASTYRAAFRLRFINSPGATPNILPLPAVTYDARLNGTPTINGTNLIDYVVAASGAEVDPTVPDWAKLPSPPQSGTDEIAVRAIVGAFAATGTVTRAESVGDGETWTDSTGCVWRVDFDRAFDFLGVTWKNVTPTRWEPHPMAFPAYLEHDGHMWTLELGSAGSYTNSQSFEQGALTLYVDKSGYYQDSFVDSMFVPIPPLSTMIGRVALTNDMPRTASDVGAASKDELVEIWNYMMAENFRVTVTNYDSTAHAPESSYEYRMGTNEPWRTVWTETNGLVRTHTAATNDALKAAKAEIAKPENRAWGRYDSTTGAPSPEGIVQVSAEGGLLIGGGMGYTAVAASGGEYWVLTSTDPTLCRTGTNGVFEIVDSSGNAAVSVRKGDKRLVPAPADGISKTADAITIVYRIESAEHPTLECAATLNGGGFMEAGADGAAFGAPTWSGGSGEWVATLQTCGNPTGFFRASYWTGGGTVVSYGAAAIEIQRIKIGNVEYTVGTATISGHTVLTLEARP